MIGGSVSAQEERPEVRMVVEGGIDGWVDARWPMRLTARIESDLLVVGELMVVYGAEVSRMEVEIPADGARTFEVVVAPPTIRGAVLVRLVPDGADDDEPVASALFRPRVAGDEILVGVVGLSALEQTLGEVRSAVSGEPITPVTVDDESDRLEEGDLEPLSYLVLDRPGPLPAAMSSWVGRGGRLITTPVALEAMGLDAVGWGSFPGVDGPVGWYGVGEGEVLAIDNPAGLDTRSWARVLRPPPRPQSGREFFGEESAVLTRTALAAERETPGYVWLPLAVLGYAVLVGPVNLWILRRRRKLEWAWFTIPALGLVGVAAFWIVGAGGVDQIVWSHGTVQVAGPAPQARSAVVAATTRARTMEISFNRGWDVFPEDSEMLTGDAAQPTIGRSGVHRYDLPPLGWLSVNAFRRDEPVDVQVEFSEQGVEMINASPDPVLVWGVHVYPKVAVGGTLGAGARGLLAWEEVFAAESQWGVGEALWRADALTQSEGSMQELPSIIQSLEEEALSEGMVDGRSLAFAVVEASIGGVSVDGREQTVPGLKLILFPIPVNPMGDAGWAFARPVWVDEAIRDVGEMREPVFAEQWIVSYRTPPGLTAPPRLVVGGFDPDFNRIPIPIRADGEAETGNGQGWEAWDWIASEFVPVDVGRDLDPARLVAPSGEVLFRVSAALIGSSPLVEGVVMWGGLP